MSKLDLVQYDLNPRPALAPNGFDPAIRDMNRDSERSVGMRATLLSTTWVHTFLRDTRGGKPGLLDGTTKETTLIRKVEGRVIW